MTRVSQVGQQMAHNPSRSISSNVRNGNEKGRHRVGKAGARGQGGPVIGVGCPDGAVARPGWRREAKTGASLFRPLEAPWA